MSHAVRPAILEFPPTGNKYTETSLLTYILANLKALPNAADIKI